MEEHNEPVIDEDVALMARVQQGDERAFAVLVNKHQKKIVNFFLRSGVQSDAEDLTQQTFLRLYRYRDRYQPTAKVTTFLFLLTRQVWIDELRRRERFDRLTSALGAEVRDETASSAADDVAAKDDWGDVAKALASLPEGQRLVVELGVYQELPYAEIAQILGIPEGTVKSRMFHALAHLRKKLS